MTLPALSAILLPALAMTTKQFGLLTSVYAFSAGISGFWLLFVGINARMITSTSLATVLPNQADRGAFMALDASSQQLASGVAATAAGLLVYQTTDGMIQGYPFLGVVVIGLMILTLTLMYFIN